MRTAFAAVALSLLCAAPAPASAQTNLKVRTSCAAQPRCYTTIVGALEAAEADTSGRWVTIEVGAGNFREKPTIRRARTRLIGRGVGRTRLHFDAVAEHSAHYDRGRWGTAGSATLTVAADEVLVSGMTIENDFDYLANDALADGDPRKISNSQAVAVTLDTASDRVLFDRVAILGYQDTLFTRGKRAIVRNSLIAGNVDFIFGNGMLLIEHSEVRTRRRGAATDGEPFASFVTAPSTNQQQPIGIVIYRSRLTRERGVADGSVALGRPWHPTTVFPDGRYADPAAVGQAVFIDCHMDAHIHRDGWASMPGTARDGTKTAIFRPQDSRFAEIRSRGPGARRRDIGIAWQAALEIAEVRKAMFELKFK
ncbi:pectin esterase [Sphingomonas sp. R647]|uniref:pectinesterase family protein n=1 Tax=Sphingomonas sp. R647 TaxID=2875233 RepID=UPI001CD4F0F4|nr:pectinesterase family protein [Sphingomonas sp. R647]MCA1197265.1 pectin esterase [Sphingomonas sp. R647]